MNLGERIVTAFFMFCFDVKVFSNRIKRRIWNKRILLWWHRLYLRKDEFDCSLDINSGAMLEMNKKERDKYLKDLFKRREIAHQRNSSRS